MYVSRPFGLPSKTTLIAAFVWSGFFGLTLGAVSTANAQTTVRDPRGFTFTVPAGYTQQPSEEAVYTFVRLIEGSDDFQVITLTPHEEPAMTEPMAQNQHADFERGFTDASEIPVTRWEYQTVRWRHFELDMVSPFWVSEGIPSAMAMVSLPLTTAFDVAGFGPETHLPQTRQDVLATIASMHGPAAAREAGGAYAMGELTGRVIGVSIGAGLVAMFFRRRRRR